MTKHVEEHLLQVIDSAGHAACQGQEAHRQALCWELEGRKPARKLSDKQPIKSHLASPQAHLPLECNRLKLHPAHHSCHTHSTKHDEQLGKQHHVRGPREQPCRILGGEVACNCDNGVCTCAEV